MENNGQINKGKSVLVVEDEELLRELITKKLVREGFSVETSTDARGVFGVLAREKPDVILLDLILAGIDGFGILEKIKADETLAHIPVLILSNLGQKEDIDRAFSLGAHDFLVKANFTLDEIIERVNTVLEHPSL